jgi:hypothetical protein
MKEKIFIAWLLFVFFSCKDNKPVDEPKTTDIQGTWQLISGTLIEKGDTTLTHYTSDPQMIKIINKSHFAFLNHDLKKGKAAGAVFAAGGGHYELTGDQYAEHLEYCSDRAWEGNDFVFTVEIRNDTLIQKGIEKIEGTLVNRLNIEKYVRVSPRP